MQEQARLDASMEWAFERYVKLLPANLYRTLPNSWEAFNYISGGNHFTEPQKIIIKISGSFMMWILNSRYLILKIIFLFFCINT